jgi:ribonuclease HII
MERLERLSYYERTLRSFGYRLIAGVDEAGRGPLAGPVVASAVILSDSPWLPGLRDSKLLTAPQRERLFDQILSLAVAVGVGCVEHDIIDRVNILKASRLAMLKAVSSLPVIPDYLLIDALRLPQLRIEQVGIVHGDNLSISIAAASVVAKVTRDRIMDGYHSRYPEYNFLSHKGYGTPEHLRRLRTFGASPIHRRTFKGVGET